MESFEIFLEILRASPLSMTRNCSMANALNCGKLFEAPSLRVVLFGFLKAPSLAEGVRGWVDSTSALQAKSATASNANISVIASERSERGNPQETLAQRIDCHANANAFTRNNKK